MQRLRRALERTWPADLQLRQGNPYHNAFVASFMKTLKQEEVYLANYETYLDVLENLPTFIEEVYNEKRVHSGIDYLTLSELEEGIKSEPSLASAVRAATVIDARYTVYRPHSSIPGCAESEGEEFAHAVVGI